MPKGRTTTRKAKTRKSIVKRFKITSKGKMLRLPTGKDHGLAKESAKKRRNLRKWIHLSEAETKKLSKLIKN